MKRETVTHLKAHLGLSGRRTCQIAGADRKMVRYHVTVPGLIGELDSIFGENGVDPIRHGLEHMLQELPSRLSVSLCNDLGDGERGCPIDTDEKVELASSGLHLGNVDVKAHPSR